MNVATKLNTVDVNIMQAQKDKFWSIFNFRLSDFLIDQYVIDISLVVTSEIETLGNGGQQW